MATLTINHKVNSVNCFISSLKDSENSYYLFVGKPDPWKNSNGQVDETSAPIANSSIKQIEHEVSKDMVFATLLTNNDVSFLTKRINWSNNVVYACYDQNNPNTFFENSYVITDTNDVFKCIYNGNNPNSPNGAPSLVKPNIRKTLGNFSTGVKDNYVWKYMYTCDPGTYNKFQTNNYIPVTPNNEVIENAVPGSIDVLKIENAGNNYQVFETGFLKNYVNNFVIELPATSSPVDNYYSGSQIYLKSGFGSGQIRKITGYSGSNKTLSVNPSFTLFENLKLQNINGLISEGDIVSQKISFVTPYYKKGLFNNGDILIQTDNPAYGILRNSNNTLFTVENLDNDYGLDSTTWFAPDDNISQTYLPIYNSSDNHVKKSGKVNITANSNFVNSVSGTNFTSEYAIGDYIRVGENANNNIRLITAVNSTVITVISKFNNTESGANCFSVNSAFSVDSVTKRNAVGNITYLNLNSAEILYSNVTPISNKFILGETVIVVDSANTNQNANGTVSFFDDDTIILSDVQGTINSGLFLYGTTSTTKAQVDTNIAFPNITAQIQQGGGFYTGVNITVRYANGVPTANGKVVSKYSSPNDLTEYIISPCVNIEGDGYGALAYCTVDLSSNNDSRKISTIKLIEPGRNYTYANVSITANTLYGTGAVVRALIAPIKGHGAEPYKELGAVYAGISKTVDFAANESYKFPLYGKYRKIGIIKNPQIKDAIFNLTEFDRSTLNIGFVNGSFQNNEILHQPSTNAAGIVVYSNSSFIELKNTKGTFANTSNTLSRVYGLSSGAFANNLLFSTNYFSLSANLVGVSEITPGGTAQINQKISNTQIRVTQVLGNFQAGDSIFAGTSNSYAKISSILIANGTTDVSYTLGKRINQTARITLTSNTKPFSQYEYVNQNTTKAYGMIASTKDEIDIVYDAVPASTFLPGDVLYNANTNSNAVITYVNTAQKYLKLSAVYNNGYNETTNKPFNVGDTIYTAGNTKITTINSLYPVITLTDVGTMSNTTHTGLNFGAYTLEGYELVGNTSGAIGTVTMANSVIHPEFIRGTGQVIYTENLSNTNIFEMTPYTSEQLKLIIKF